ncbi:MAG: response regulator [Pontiellaceae bacterium]|nr:response regulator [Pontiellaceae bacterium]
MSRILIIDDDPYIRTVFKRYLEGNGYEVEIAEDGNAGLKSVQRSVPDLVVTDVMMPEKDGLEVVLELRKTCPDVPVIAISGGMRIAPMDFLPMVKKFGAKRVLYKPVDLEELSEAIEQELKNN